MKSWTLGALAVAALSLVLLYGHVIAGLFRAWRTNDDYSHGFLVAPLCAYLVWERRHRLIRCDVRPSMAGLALVVTSLLVMVAGELGAEFFLARVSLLGVLAGSVMFVLGAAHVRTLALPFGVMLLTIPLPAIVFNGLAFPLQLVASRVAELSLSTLSIPVLREGNVIFLASTTLEVAEACSGIRSLVSLLTLGIVYGYFTEASMPRRVILAVAMLPIAIVANAARVAGTGFLAHAAGPAAAEGFFHSFAGWAVFMSAALMLFLLQHVLWLVKPPAPTAQVAAEVAL